MDVFQFLNQNRPKEPVIKQPQPEPVIKPIAQIDPILIPYMSQILELNV